MALTDEDIKIALKIEPDTKGLPKAMGEFIKGMTAMGGKGAAGVFGQVFGGFAQGGMKGAAGTAASIGGEALAAASPIGAVIAEIAPIVAKGLGEIVATPFKAIGSGLSAVAEGLHGLQGPLGPVGVGFDMLSSGLQKVGDVIKRIPIVGDLLGPMVGAIAVLPGILKDITTSLVGMARLGSPAAFKMWAMALEDIQGVIGQSFVPILNVMRDSVRLFGDVLATILPNMEEMDEAIAPLKEGFALLANALEEFVSENGPLIRTYIVAMFESLVMVLGATAQSLSWVVRCFNLLLSPLSAILRLFDIGGAAGIRSSVDAAARPAQIQGIEEYQRGLQISAFSQPGGQINYQERSSNTLVEILAVLRGQRPPSGMVENAWEGVARAVGAQPGVGTGIGAVMHHVANRSSFGLLGG